LEDEPGQGLILASSPPTRGGVSARRGIMKEIDGIPFECTQCGECCKWDGSVYLKDGDIKKLANKLEEGDQDRFLEKYTRTIHAGKDIVLRNKENSSECVFLKNNKCSMWEDRPKQCDEYPVAYSPECPGFQTKKENLMKKMAEKVRELYQKMSSSETNPDFEKAVTNSLYVGLSKDVKVANVTSKALEGGVSMFFDQNRIKIASLDDLFAFNRVDEKHIIHKSTKDLWNVESDENGEVHITRLFESGKPIKG
jgi:Fe-S-cluster containining protein